MQWPWACLLGDESTRLLRSNRLLDFVADISYPLYVVHGLAGYVLMFWLRALGVPQSPIWRSRDVATVVAYLLHVLVEVRSQSLGQSLGQRFFTKPVTNGLAPELLDEPDQPARAAA